MNSNTSISSIAKVSISKPSFTTSSATLILLSLLLLRYGSFFKSHILGCPTRVSMDPETNRYILMNESKGLVPGYPQSMLDTLGKSNIAAVHGSTHRHIRAALLSLLCPSIIRSQLLPKLDDFMRCHRGFQSSKLMISKVSDMLQFNHQFLKFVIFETSRFATIVNRVLRKTTQDMELNGFVIPKGWRIYVYTRENNYDPCLYPDPLAFNPWRWMDKSLESQNYFFMFGGGTRQCPGKELGIAEISTFLHYFVTRYRWEEVGGDKLMQMFQAALPHLLGAAASPRVAARENRRQCLKAHVLLHIIHSSNQNQPPYKKHRETDHLVFMRSITDLQSHITESCKMVSALYGPFKSKATEHVTHSDFKKAKDKVMFKKKEGVPEGICFAYF
ncbi:Cytochrome P450 85A1 [Camellia lanceoleosa]|uniref:Cytochrome P450 85A1 n=1 Tax=Camellia lanceoleosa TaxID=1840588 RepID=A0ACC0III4_9ERIC|nr:Cytochrome P450 85A1 [Camellia lanceoleosa]